MARGEALFTTAEAADLAEAPPGAIEKAIEEGIVDVRKAPAAKASPRRRRLLSAQGVYYVAFLRRCDLRFSREQKRHLWARFKDTPADRLLTARWRVSAGIEVHPGELLTPVHERVVWYARARARWIDINPKIMGGTPVIKGTRMTVYSVLGRVEHGDSIEDVLEDNPDLPREAIEAAVAYARANPFVGRPGGKPWRAAARSVV